MKVQCPNCGNSVVVKGLGRKPLNIPLKCEALQGALQNYSHAGGAVVCSQAEAETINDLLSQGKSLRDIESEFGVSRSSLSRHKQHII